MNYLMYITILLVLFVTFIETKRPQPKYWDPFTYPNPRFRPKSCKIQKPGWICDPNEILTIDEKESVTTAAQRLRDQTNCKCDRKYCNSYDKYGFSIGIAVVKYMAVPDSLTNTQMKKRAKDFAYELRKKWNFGQCNDDIIIFLSAGDRKVWTSVGPFTRKYLSDKQVADIYKYAQPFLSESDWARALTTMINGYNDVLSGRSAHVPQGNKPGGGGGGDNVPGWGIAIIIIVIFCVIVFCIFFCVHCGQSSTSGGSSGSGNTNVIYNEPYYGPDRYKPVRTDEGTHTDDLDYNEGNSPSARDPDGGGGAGGDF